VDGPSAVIAWQLCDGEIDPVGPGGVVHNGEGSRWFMVSPDGKAIFSELWGTASNIETALEWVKKDIKADHARAERRRARSQTVTEVTG
jgi:hypothetical protein